VLALLGVRPVWDDASRRVTGFEVMSINELGRPPGRRHGGASAASFRGRRFPPRDRHGLDDAIRAVAALDEAAEVNPLRAPR